MKKMRFKLGGWVSALFSLLATQPEATAALSTQFTYQGRLDQGGNPATGLYDFSFKLYDALSDGSLVGSPSSIGLLTVPVTNGLFTVTLDFGGGVFDGADRWLEIAVQPSTAPGTAETLSPRQRLTPTPYAIFAGTSGQAASVNWANILGIPAVFADGVDNDTTYSAGSGLSVDGGNQFSVNFSGGGSAPTVAHSDHNHFGQEWLGSSSGYYGLAVRNAAPGANAILGHAVAITGNSAGVRGESDSTDGTGVSALASAASGETVGMSGVASSPGGIGVVGTHTASTGAKPGVYGRTYSTEDEAIGVLGEVNSTTPGDFSAAVRGLNRGTTDTGIGVWGSHGGSGWGVLGQATSGIGVGGRTDCGISVHGYAGGAAGIGVYGLHAAATGTNPGVHGVTYSTETSAVGVLGEVNSSAPGGFSAAVRGINNGTGGSGIGIWGSQAGGGWGVLGTAASGQGVRGEATAGTGVLGYGTVGVLGSTVSPTGAGVHATGSGPTGTALAIEGGAIRVVGAGPGTSTPAFVHVVATSTNLSTISNPLCDGNQNVLLLVTPVSLSDPPQARSAGVTYNGSQWQLFPTDPAGPFLPGQRFNILVIKP
jgi:hypothetical protein